MSTKSIPEISVIIPTLNEEAHLPKLLGRLNDSKSAIEVIVVDGNSTDKTVEIAQTHGAHVEVLENGSRPIQLNAGASLARASLLYFVHADTLPPADFDQQILNAVKNDRIYGSFRFKFDSDARPLRINAWFTRFPFLMFRGGDQSLFIHKTLFQKLNGYREDFIAMEDFDILRRARRIGRFRLIQDDVIVSARKYHQNPYWKVNISNFIIFALYYLGVHPRHLLRLYMRLIRHPKG